MDINSLRETGLNQRDSGRLQEAIITFTKLKDDYPSDQRVYVDLGICYRQLEDYYAARTVLNELLKLDILQENWKSLAEDQLFHIEQALLTTRYKKPITNDFYEYKQAWLHIIRENDNLALNNIDQVWSTNFICSQALGASSIFVESFWLMLKEISESESEKFSNTISLISKYLLDIGQYSKVDQLITQLPDDSFVRTKLMIDLGAKSKLHSNYLITGTEKADSLDNENLTAHANTALLANSFMDFDLDKANEYINEVNLFFKNKGNDKPHPFHLIKTKYLNEMQLCEGIQELTKIPPEKNIHETYLKVLKLNENHRQKVVISSYYLSKILEDKYSDIHINYLATSQYDSDVPKTIIQYWDNKDIPEDIQQCINSVRHAAPNYKHTVFNKETATNFITKNYSPKYLELFKKCSHPALQADVFRMLYLFSEGGIWIDADEEHLAIDSMPLESLFKEESLRFLKVFQLEIQNNFIVVGKKNPILGRMIKDMDFTTCSDDKHVWWNTGPGYLTLCLAQMYAESEVNNDAEKSYSKLKLVHNNTYNSMFRTPELDYKKTALSWQVNSTSN